MQRVAQMQAKQPKMQGTCKIAQGMEIKLKNGWNSAQKVHEWPKMQKFQNCYEDEILKRLRDYKKIQNFNVIVLEAVKKVLIFVSQEPMS